MEAGNISSPSRGAEFIKASMIAMLIGAGGFIAGSIYFYNPLTALIVFGMCVVITVVSRAWGGFLLLAVATQFNGYHYDVGSLTLRPGNLIFTFVILGWFLLFVTGKIRLHATVLDIPIAGLVITGAISSFLNSKYPGDSYQALVLQLLYISMYYFTVNLLLDRREKIETAIKVMMILALLHVIYAQLALAFITVGVNIGGIFAGQLTHGFMEEPNIFAAFCSVMIVVFLAHLLTYEKRKIVSSRFLILGLILLSLSLLTSYTRAAWIALPFGVIPLIFFNRPKLNVVNPKAIAILALSVIVVALVLFPLVDYFFSSNVGTENLLYDRLQNALNFESGSGAGRIDRQRFALERWEDHPIIGNGVLSSETEDPATGTTTRQWLYSTMVQSLHDTGIIGAFFMLLIHVIPVIYALFAYSKAASGIRKASLVGMSLGAIVMFIASQASSFFWLGFPWLYLGILVAMSKDTIDTAKGESGYDTVNNGAAISTDMTQI